MQRWDAFWGVTVQDHRITMLYIKGLNFFLWEFWYTCKKANKFLFYCYPFENFPFNMVLNEIFTLTSPFAFSAFSYYHFLQVIQINIAFY